MRPTLLGHATHCHDLYNYAPIGTAYCLAWPDKMHYTVSLDNAKEHKTEGVL